MATEKQILANRRNAEKSTGPTSDRGKSISKLNGLRHGVYAETLILPGEDRAEFEALHDRLQQLYQPQDVTQQKMVADTAAVEWKLRISRRRPCYPSRTATWITAAPSRRSWPAPASALRSTNAARR
jgi:hypothetical protein